MKTMVHRLAASAFLLAVLAPPAHALENTSQTQAADTSRILSIGGDVTEILYALRLSDHIVAVDTTSLYPPEALSTKRKVGYMRALSAEGVLSVAPSLILASEGAGPPETVNALKASSVPYVVIPDTPTAVGVVTKIRSVARAVGMERRGAKLSMSVTEEFLALERAREKITQPRKVLFVLNASGGRMIVGGRGTSADTVLKLAGADNAASSITGFKPISSEALIAIAPDAILVMKGGRGGHDAAGLRELPAVKASSAAKNNRIKDVDGLPLLGFGPRTPKAARDIMVWLYPEFGATE